MSERSAEFAQRVEVTTEGLVDFLDLADPHGEDADLVQSIRHIVSEGMSTPPGALS